jgi:hypothetical protein
MPRPILGNGVADTRGDESLRQGRAAEFQDRALGQGSTRPGSLVGKANAVWAEVNITGLASLTDVRVPHALGAVPVLCELVEARNAGGTPFVVASPILKERWDKSQCRVAVNIVSGTQAGTVLKFRVGGE